jgi:hypothetical protein
MEIAFTRKTMAPMPTALVAGIDIRKSIGRMSALMTPNVIAAIAAEWKLLMNTPGIKYAVDNIAIEVSTQVATNPWLKRVGSVMGTRLFGAVWTVVVVDISFSI